MPQSRLADVFAADDRLIRDPARTGLPLMLAMLRSAAAVLTALILVVGCGGGGEADAGGSAGSRVAPSVTYVTPVSDAKQVGTQTPLTVSFSKPMNAGSLDTAVALVDTNSGATVPLQGVSYDATNRIATFTPQQPLQPDGSYRATVSSTARDSDGNALDSAYSWGFGTAAGPDTTPPSVSSHAPGSGASGVALNADVAMSFSEPMNVASLNDAFVLTRGGVAVAGRLAYIGQAAVFTGASPLAPQAEYVATLRRSASDLAGNGMSADHVWTFSTAAAAASDTTPPRVLAVTPAPDRTGVPRDATLSVTFDEPIYPFIYGKIDGAVIAVSIDYNTHTVTMAPGAPLRAGGGYQASVRVMDLAGNLMSAPYAWSFGTAP